uniref:Uncharacterized protein n=1 Tax=Anguilla anguilla TaxID=7936 RepID=A0A0E9PEV8_ANGAN
MKNLFVNFFRKPTYTEQQRKAIARYVKFTTEKIILTLLPRSSSKNIS